MSKFLFAILFLSSIPCFSQADTAARGTVYVLRSSGFNGSARQFKIFVDGNLVCKISNESYVILDIPVGQHEFAVQMDGQKLKENTQVVNIAIEAGAEYFLSTVLDTDPLWCKTHIDELTPNSGRSKISRLKNVDCNK